MSRDGGIPLWYFLINILLIAGGIIFTYIYALKIKYEDIGESHIFHMVNQELFNVFEEKKYCPCIKAESYIYIGYCEEVSTLAGIMYNLIYDKPYYIVIFPFKRHTAVVLDDTLYTTSNNTHPIKIVYKCEVDKTIKEKVLVENTYDLKGVLISYLARLNKYKSVVKCEWVPYVHYNNTELFMGVRVFPLRKIAKWRNEKKDIGLPFIEKKKTFQDLRKEIAWGHATPAPGPLD